MHVNGQPQRPTKVEHWESTNGYTNYTTVEWQSPVDGTKRTSCNCPGWANKRKDTARGCCHTKDMEGTKTCNRRRVESVTITSVEQARQEIPDIHDGRELRAIMID